MELQKTIYLVRGLPGSGKTTIANKLCNIVCSADDYFDKIAEQAGSTYSEVFDPIHLPDAHGQCQKDTEQAMKDGKNVAVANTFVKKWEAKRYFDMASEYGYTVCVIECQSQFGSVHDVPNDTILRMMDDWDKNLKHTPEVVKNA
ncbi:ATP-binding protein [PVC group bacterium]|nr:ATP-binding protein [PVC group bacterium]